MSQKKVRLLTNIEYTPQMILDQIKANYPNAKSILISVVDEDGSSRVAWSSMPVETMCFHLQVVMTHVTDAVRGD